MDLFNMKTTFMIIQIPEQALILMDHLEQLLHINSQVFGCCSDSSLVSRKSRKHIIRTVQMKSFHMFGNLENKLTGAGKGTETTFGSLSGFSAHASQ